MEMEFPKTKKICCPRCGNTTHYRVVKVVAEKHWWEIKNGVPVDYEHNIETIDQCVLEYVCLKDDCGETVSVNDEKQTILATVEPP